ncbi:MAG: hypothetical protein K0R39_800 [Symbiobacteriaceae bacterium]|jgi:hypothetical protein|nr:hypothetical protein [Symbiobacteriaceae bacterium]
MEQLLVSLLVYATILALALWKPNAGRIFLGIFFLLMAWGVNFTITLMDPPSFVGLGSGSFIPFYRTIFTDLVGAAPVLFGVIAVAYETTVGLLILASGRRTQVGLIMGIIFLMGSSPFSMSTLANPVLALALQYLLSKPHHLSLAQQLRLRFARS